MIKSVRHFRRRGGDLDSCTLPLCCSTLPACHTGGRCRHAGSVEQHLQWTVRNSFLGDRTVPFRARSQIRPRGPPSPPNLPTPTCRHPGRGFPAGWVAHLDAGKGDRRAPLAYLPHLWTPVRSPRHAIRAPTFVLFHAAGMPYRGAPNVTVCNNRYPNRNIGLNRNRFTNVFS